MDKSSQIPLDQLIIQRLARLEHRVTTLEGATLVKIDDITVRICDEDRERLDQLGQSIGWLRDHLEEIRAFSQIPAISPPSNPVAPLVERDLPGWQKYIIQQIDKSASSVCSGPSLSQATSVVWNTNDLPPNTTVRIGDKDYSTICLDCGKPLSECKCSDPRAGIGAVVDQPGD